MKNALFTYLIIILIAVFISSIAKAREMAFACWSDDKTIEVIFGTSVPDGTNTLTRTYDDVTITMVNIDNRRISAILKVADKPKKGFCFKEVEK